MKPLKRITRELVVDCPNLQGDWTNLQGYRGYCFNLWSNGTSLWGICTGLRGNYTGLRGNCSDRLWGDCTNLEGDCTGLYGDCSGLRGNCTGLEGNLDDIPMDQRKKHPNLTDWIEGDILG